MSEKKKMTRDEWYSSADFFKLRFLNNIAAGICHKTQEMYDVLAIIRAEHPDLMLYDKACLVERQSQVVRLEAERLWAQCRALDSMLKDMWVDITDDPKPLGHEGVA